MSVAIDLAGRVALVTGASGGLGRACARTLAEAGAAVALSDLPGERLEQTAAEVSGVAIGADLRSERAARELVDGTVRELGSLDAVVACAGVMQTKSLLDLTEADWRRVLDVNLSGTFFLTQAAGRAMLERNGGAIVLLASVAARSGRPFAAHYSASKTALLSLTKSAAAAFAPRVRVNAICPGVFLTDMWEGIMRDRVELFGADAGEDYLREVREAAPLGRAGDPAEVGSAALFLVSDASSYITGQALNVDGGLEMD